MSKFELRFSIWSQTNSLSCIQVSLVCIFSLLSQLSVEVNSCVKVVVLYQIFNQHPLIILILIITSNLHVDLVCTRPPFLWDLFLLIQAVIGALERPS